MTNNKLFNPLLFQASETKFPLQYPSPSKSFENSQKQYTKEGLPQSSLTLLRTMARSSKIPEDLKSFPLLQLFKETCKEFLLNDLEIIMWQILLDKIVWVKPIKSLMVLFLYSAYGAKCSMNHLEDLDELRVYIEQKYKGFMNGYHAWSNENFEKLYVNFREFNAYVKKMMCLALVDKVDYNFYVDEILMGAPPNFKESEVELVFDQEVDNGKFPELLNLNSVLENENFGLPVLSSWGSLDMAKDLDRIDM